MSCLRRRSPRLRPSRAWLAWIPVAACAVWLAATLAEAADVTARAADEAAIRAAAASYIAALEEADGEKLAALWTTDGDIVDAAGNVFNGRAAVTLDKTATDRPEFQLQETRLRFLAADVAVEDGTVKVIPAAGAPLTGRFSATWVKRDGVWKLAALREARGSEPTAAEALAELDWMVGDWVVIDDPAAGAAPGKPVIEVSCRWNESKTYLARVMTITHTPDAPPLEITQRIGWDPLSKEVRSWAFGSDGSHGEADWSRDGRSWVAQARAVLPDGSQSTSLNIYTYDGKDRCAWRSLPTHVGAEHVPPVNMTMIRKPVAAGSQPQRTP
jgi:uncharacterized protein (TIGR02246 family)